MIILSTYNGVTRCNFNAWEEQKDCEYAEKSRFHNTCMWMREDGTCSEPNACAGKSKIDLSGER